MITLFLNIKAIDIDTLLIVDDIRENLNVLSRLRRRNRPALILIEVMVLEMEGYRVPKQRCSMPATENTPEIFRIALNDAKDEELGLNLGADDYITKPTQSVVVLARVRTLLETKWVHDWVQSRNILLKAEVARLMVLANIFDAWVNMRVYKPVFSFEVARQIFLDGKDAQFHPDVVDAFMQNFLEFCEAAEKMRNGDGVATS